MYLLIQFSGNILKFLLYIVFEFWATTAGQSSCDRPSTIFKLVTMCPFTERAGFEATPGPPYGELLAHLLCRCLRPLCAFYLGEMLAFCWEQLGCTFRKKILGATLTFMKHPSRTKHSVKHWKCKGQVTHKPARCWLPLSNTAVQPWDRVSMNLRDEIFSGGFYLAFLLWGPEPGHTRQDARFDGKYPVWIIWLRFVVLG